MPGPEQSERRSRLTHTVFPWAGGLSFRTPVPALDFQTTRNGTVAVVAATGELDLSGATILEAELERLAAEPDLGPIVLDLRGLEFMDSSGLRLVVLADMRAREAGRRFALVKGPETVHRVFEITRMSERLDFVAAPEDVQ
jgi:anti-sigma B factor antagonist